jgi:hypothetical protein
VSASTDDCTRSGATTFSTTAVDVRVGTVAYGNGFRFLDVPIPPLSVISSARLKFTAKTTQTGNTFNTIIDGEANVVPLTFSTYTDYDDRVRTSNYVNYAVPSTWTAGVVYTSSDIVYIIQEIIDLADWQSGNNITLFWSADAQAANKIAYSFNGDSAKAVQLYIEYSVPVWITYYKNHNEAFIIDLYLYQAPMDNETTLQSWEDLQLWVLSAQNGSWVFERIYVDGVNYTDNPTTLTLPAYNMSAWVYIQPYTPATTPSPFNAASVLAGFLLLGLPLFTIALAVRKRDLDQAENERQAQAILDAENSKEETEET